MLNTQLEAVLAVDLQMALCIYITVNWTDILLTLGGDKGTQTSQQASSEALNKPCDRHD